MSVICPKPETQNVNSSVCVSNTPETVSETHIVPKQEPQETRVASCSSTPSMPPLPNLNSDSDDNELEFM